MTDETNAVSLVRCADCRFWAAFNDNEGTCRRTAPWPSDGHDPVAHWPETYATEGCGDGRPRGTDANAGLVACADCVFWARSALDRGLAPVRYSEELPAWWRQAGHCTRHAPLPSGKLGLRLGWPATHASCSCGEGKAGHGAPEPVPTVERPG
jgi:hypothetical protein